MDQWPGAPFLGYLHPAISNAAIPGISGLHKVPCNAPSIRHTILGIRGLHLIPCNAPSIRHTILARYQGFTPGTP